MPASCVEPFVGHTEQTGDGAVHLQENRGSATGCSEAPIILLAIFHLAGLARAEHGGCTDGNTTNLVERGFLLVRLPRDYVRQRTPD